MNDLKVKTDSLLATIADEELNITETQYKEAEQHYQAVGEWLGEDDTAISDYEPEIYPQGSFLLGTVVKPIDDDYDIDLVCFLRNLTDTGTTPEKLKKMVGERLSENGKYQPPMLEEMNRCWRLNYAETSKFHMDIIPAVACSNISELILREGLYFKETLVKIPDKKLEDWTLTNPKGYADWFKNQMKAQFMAGMEKVALFKEAMIEDVPTYKIKTSLQRAVQILKRHRDEMFQYDKKDKPISIIITTLAAHAYGNEENILDALINIVRKMPIFITEEWDNDVMAIVKKVKNPVNDDENFADKWPEHQQREVKFYRWLEQVREDLNTALQQKDIVGLAEKLQLSLGDRMVRVAYKRAFGELPTDRARLRYTPTHTETKRPPTKLWGGQP